MVGHRSPACVYQSSLHVAVFSLIHDSFPLSSSSHWFPTPTHHQFTTQPTVVSEETQELLSRVAGLQQEKWELEERVGGKLVRFAPLLLEEHTYTLYTSL